MPYYKIFPNSDQVWTPYTKSEKRLLPSGNHWKLDRARSFAVAYLSKYQPLLITSFFAWLSDAQTERASKQRIQLGVTHQWLPFHKINEMRNHNQQCRPCSGWRTNRMPRIPFQWVVRLDQF